MRRQWACACLPPAANRGKCKECLVEVTEGMHCLSTPVPEEAHLRDNFRLSCRTRVIVETGIISCHTMHRGTMRIESQAFAFGIGQQQFTLEPTVTRDGDRILLDGHEIDRSPGPIHGLAMDLGTTTVVLRLFNPGNRRTASRGIIRKSTTFWWIRCDGPDSV